MADFFASCVAKYLELAGNNVKPLRKVDTPYLAETPAQAETPSEDEPRGELQPIASKVLMKVLYGARMARYDLLRPTCWLATRVTKWTETCDRALHRLMAYIQSTLHLRMCGWIGDPMDAWEFVVYSDADFAGCKDTGRSTTGAFTCISA